MVPIDCRSFLDSRDMQATDGKLLNTPVTARLQLLGVLACVHPGTV